jgi:hypothetical protein
MSRVAVVTTVHGRLRHLAGMRAGLARQGADCEHVVVRMGGPEPWAACGPGPRVVPVDVPLPGGPDEGRLPLARARNAGAATTDADLLVFLDVDCVPSAGLVRRYAEASSVQEGLLAGPVGYLPPGVDASIASEPDLAALGRPHPARPVPGPVQLLPENRYELFWSLSFAVRRDELRDLGGFCEDYVGYGAEDTDLAYAARAAGVPMTWVGGAVAWHQHHEVEDPPLRHLRDIVRNATVFHDRWGSWPMVGWLQAFADEGLVEWQPGGQTLRLARDAAATAG